MEKVSQKSASLGKKVNSTINAIQKKSKSFIKMTNQIFGDNLEDLRNLKYDLDKEELKKVA